MNMTDELTLHQFNRSMESRDLSPNTIANYAFTLGAFGAWLDKRGYDGLVAVTTGQVEEYLACVAKAQASASLATVYRRLHAFYSWCVKREMIDGPSPMAPLTKPAEDVREIPLPDPADLAAVVRACEGRDYRARRDMAIVRTLLCTGTPRAEALATLLLSGLDLRRDKLTVIDKGSKERTISLTPKASHALMLYLRGRDRHPKARVCDRLFLGTRGAMTRDGMYQVIAARCEQAGVRVISPHKWRHFSAHEWFSAGGSEGDAMYLFGWKSSAMAHRYAAAAAATRAQQHAAERMLGDKIG